MIHLSHIARKWQSLDSPQGIWQQSPYLTYFTKVKVTGELEGFDMEWLLGFSYESIKVFNKFTCSILLPVTQGKQFSVFTSEVFSTSLWNESESFLMQC